MQVEVYNKDGKQAGSVELNDAIFAVQPNEDAMHLSVVAHLARKRQGTHKTKVRSEVSGGGRKPWKQKGRGTARAGSTRSPIWVGGGTTHGPKPHTYDLKLPKKVNRLARKSALSLRISEKNVTVVEDITLDNYKTKEITAVIQNLDLQENSLLMVVPEYNEKVYRSARNINRVDVIVADDVSTYDILSHKKILVFKGAIEIIENTLNK